MHSSREKLIATVVALAMIMILCVTCIGAGEPPTEGDGDWDYETNSPDMFSIPTGNVGIGTTSPSEKLDVNGNIKLSGNLKMDAATDKEIRLYSGRIISQSVPNRFTVESFAAGQPLFLRGPGGIQFYLDSSEGMRITDTGNVGIGTDTPETELDVVGTVQMTGFKMPTGASNGYVLTSDADGVGTWQAAGDGSADGCWQCPGTAVYLAPGKNNVGIGTENPGNYKLKVAGGIGIGDVTYSSTNGITCEGPIVTQSTEQGFALRLGGFHRWEFVSPSAGGVGIKQIYDMSPALKNEYRLFIDDSGKVGIGTTTPTAELYVVGDIKKTGTNGFVQDHPNDPSKEIVYVSLEGPEAGTYIRGTAQLVDGEAVIELPEHFSLVTSDEGLTVQLTPVGEWLQLYVVEKGTQRIVVREANGKNGQFDYLVQGVRKGYENHEVIRDK